MPNYFKSALLQLTSLRVLSVATICMLFCFIDKYSYNDIWVKKFVIALNKKMRAIALLTYEMGAYIVNLSNRGFNIIERIIGTIKFSTTMLVDFRKFSLT